MPETYDPCLESAAPHFPQLTSAIIQDGNTIPPKELEARAARIAAKLRQAGRGRLVLFTDAAATIAVGLAACAACDWEIALLREDAGENPGVLNQFGAAALLDDDLDLRFLETRDSAPSSGFSVLIASSGTTGSPKLALHSFDRLTGRIRRPPAGQRKGRWLLAYHPATFAGVQVILTALISGDDLIALSDGSAARLAEAAVSHRPSMASGTPSFWRAFLMALGGRSEDLALDRITLGGETADQATLDRLRSAFPGAAITHIYASTEAGALFAVKDGRAGFPAAWLEHPVDGVRLRIRDGLLEVASPRRMHGYVEAPEGRRTSAAADGWLNTGDEVTRSGDRILFLGRTGSSINVGGFKVSPEEVESALLEVEGVADARVFGTKNAITGSLVSADITLEDPRSRDRMRETIVRHAHRRLDPHKVPRVIRFVERIELTQSGKKARRT